LASTASGEVLLVDGLQLLVEEKEVGPEVLPGADLLATPDPDHTPQVNLEKGLSTSDILKSHPEVMAALQEAALEAGSVGGEEFDIRFNVDAFSPGVIHADPPEVLERDRKLLRETVAFLTDVVVPRMVRECVQLSLVPTDGASLKTAMHARGINMRYLGRVATLAGSREDLEHLKRLSVSEMVVRVAKRRLRRLLQETPYEKVSEAIAHFLNCFLGQTAEGGGGGREREHAEETAGVLVNGHASNSKKKQKKKKSSKGRASSECPHLKLTPANLWAHIVAEVKDYYKYSIEQSSAVELCSDLGVQRVVWLGELCKKTGLSLSGCSSMCVSQFTLH
jgi:protein TIF31